jgi:hypothetical protein
MEGIIFDIKHCAIHDGPGIRTTVFFKVVHLIAGGVIILKVLILAYRKLKEYGKSEIMNLPKKPISVNVLT